VPVIRFDDAVCVIVRGIVLSAIIASPHNSAIALCIMLAGLPVYYLDRPDGLQQVQNSTDMRIASTSTNLIPLAFVASSLTQGERTEVRVVSNLYSHPPSLGG
jgi:hypothetical protein